MNLFDLPGQKSESEICELLALSGRTKIERIVSRGQTSGWYDQNEDEFVALLSGRAEIEFDGRSEKLSAGDTLFIPAHQRHRVAYTSKEPACVWLCVFCGR